MPRSAFGWDLIDFDKLKRPSTAFAASVYIFVFIILIVVLFLVGASIWRLIAGAGDYSSEKGADAARNLLFAIGAILAAPFIAWRTWISHLQWKNSNEQLAIQGETLNTSLLMKSIDMLGAMRDENIIKIDSDKNESYQNVKRKNLELRIGGILILKRIVISSEKESLYIIDILREYIVSNTQEAVVELDRNFSEEGSGGRSFNPESFKKSSIDVEICVKAISEISQKIGNHAKISLGKSLISNINLSKLDFKYIDMSDCYMICVDLSNASMDFCKIDGEKMFDCKFYGTNLALSYFESQPYKRFYHADDRTVLPSGYEYVVDYVNFIYQYKIEPSRYFVKKRN